jgi:hypothetical protein
MNEKPKFFIVSEKELEELVVDVQLNILNPEDMYLKEAQKESYAACRARPVVEVELGVYNVRTDS